MRICGHLTDDLSARANFKVPFYFLYEEEEIEEHSWRINWWNGFLLSLQQLVSCGRWILSCTYQGLRLWNNGYIVFFPKMSDEENGKRRYSKFLWSVLRRREGASHIGKSLSQDPGVVLVGQGVEPRVVRDCPKERRSRQGRKGCLWWKSRRCRHRSVEVQGLACSNRWSQRRLLVPPGLLPLWGAHCVVLAYLGGCWVSISGWSTFRGTSPRSCPVGLARWL